MALEAASVSPADRRPARDRRLRRISGGDFRHREQLRSQLAYRDFRAGLRATMLLPGRLLPVAAAVLATIELVAAAGLAGAAVLVAAGGPGAFPLAESALAIAVATIAVLTAGVSVVIRRGTMAPCACFGARTARPLRAAHLIRNGCLLVVLAAGLIGGQFDHVRPALAGSALAMVTGLLAAVLFVRWDDLADLFAATSPARPR